MKSRKYFIYK